VTTRRKVIVRIGTSADGFIARPDGDLEWLTSRPAPRGFYGMNAFVKSIDTKVLGRKTYEMSRRMGAKFDAKNPHIVFSRHPPSGEVPSGVQFVNDALGHVAAAVNPFEEEELASLRAERAKSEHPLGDLPLVVLTRGRPEERGPNGTAIEAEHRRDHEAIAAMSRTGKLVIAARSGHHVNLDEPDLVIKAIREVLVAVGK
jgi:hypothetical protein